MMSAIAPGSKEITLAADKGYQDQTCIEGLRALGVVPLVAEYTPSKNWENWLNDKDASIRSLPSARRSGV